MKHVLLGFSFKLETNSMSNILFSAHNLKRLNVRKLSKINSNKNVQHMQKMFEHKSMRKKKNVSMQENPFSKKESNLTKKQKNVDKNWTKSNVES